MAGRPKKQTTTASATVEKTMVAEDSQEVVVKENVEEIEVELKPLEDGDDIEVMSLVPNVTYKDEKTYDYYEWREAGSVELVSFESLRNMYRNYRGYFKNLWLKPLDKRVLKQFKIEKLYDNYDKILDTDNYTLDTIGGICDEIHKLPNSAKISVLSLIRDKVDRGDIRDVKIIKSLEEKLRIELI